MQCLISVTRCSFRSVYPYKEILSLLLLNKPKEPVLFTKQPFLAHEKLIKPLFIIILLLQNYVQSKITYKVY